MGDFAKSVVRTAVQLAWGSVVAWLTVRHIAVPDEVTVWVTDATVGVVMLGVTGVLRFLETRSPDSALGRAARSVAKVLMLGASWRPKYIPPAPVFPGVRGGV